MAATIEQIPGEPGVFWRLHPVTGQRARWLSISYQHHGKTRIESAKTTSIPAARKLRARRLVADADGAAISSGTLTVTTCLERLLTNYRQNNRTGFCTVRAHVRALVPVIGALKAKTLRTTDIDALKERWQQEPTGPHGTQPPVTNVTINRRLETLRRALNLAVKAGELARRPEIEMLDESASRRGQYIEASDRVLLGEHLPDYVASVFEFACEYGVRKGQLAQVERTWVDPARRVITFPPRVTKRRRQHQIPLEGRGWAIVERLLALGAERPWCPYLFHGLRCHAGRRPSTRYGCLGDFRAAWENALSAAGLPVGRKAGGIIFHNTRNTAVTDLLAGGMPQQEAMRVSGHETTAMIDWYDMGNLEALRAHVEKSRASLAALDAAREVIASPLHPLQSAAECPGKPA
jgi:integrase